MIVLDLCCGEDHRFEGWFASTAAFEAQMSAQLVSCPVCSSANVRRLPSAPYVQTRHGGERPAPPESNAVTAQPAPPSSSPAPATQDALAAAMKLMRQLASSAENVGERLPEEARRIHYGEAQARNIRGAASAKDVESLLEEGIMVMPLLPAEDELH